MESTGQVRNLSTADIVCWCVPRGAAELSTRAATRPSRRASSRQPRPQPRTRSATASRAVRKRTVPDHEHADAPMQAVHARHPRPGSRCPRKSDAFASIQPVLSRSCLPPRAAGAQRASPPARFVVINEHTGHPAIRLGHHHGLVFAALYHDCVTTCVTENRITRPGRRQTAQIAGTATLRPSPETLLRVARQPRPRR